MAGWRWPLCRSDWHLCIVVGTDYPLLAGLAHPIEEVKALGLDAADQAKILRGSAKELLRL
ncbi:MAG: hypothetical protein IVW54_19295 [Candidatus Binataceae bacterium]|nr:hypothetical protein [Candidatus Binataceae bacterium]